MPRGVYDRSKLKGHKTGVSTNKAVKTGGRNASSSNNKGSSDFVEDFQLLQGYFGNLIHCKVAAGMTNPEIENEIKETLSQLRLYRESHFLKLSDINTVPMNTDHDNDIDDKTTAGVITRPIQAPMAAPAVSTPRPFVPAGGSAQIDRRT